MRSWLLVACCFSALALPLHADDGNVAPSTTSLRALIVPSDQPETWPAGEWTSVPAEDYAAFVEWLNNAGQKTASDSILGVAEYVGTLDGNDLIEGSVTIAVESGAGEPGLATLGEFSPRVQNLRWEDGSPTIWGSAPDQVSYVWIEPARGSLAAEWIQSGERFLLNSGSNAGEPASIVRFDLELPSAVSSRLRLQVPATRHLRCIEGVLSGSQPITGSELNEWTIECGARGRISFILSDVGMASAPAPWIADLTTLATAKSDGLQFDAELTVESSDGFPAELSLRIPRELSITSVRTVSDATVEYQVSEEGSRGLLRIVVPNSVTKRYAFRIRGVMPLSLQRQMVYPFISVPDAAAVTGSWTLKVDRPLEIKDLTPQGLRQTGLTVGGQGESWQFVSIDDEPRLAFEVGLPETSFQQITYCVVDLDRPVPEMSAVTSLRCLRGTIYATEWLVPEDWSITAVQSRDAVIASWTSEDDPEFRFQKLRVEYREPVDATEQIAVEIVARSRPWHVDELRPLPLIECRGSDSREVKLVLRYPSGLRWEHTSSQLDGPFPIVDDSDEIPAPIRESLGTRAALEFWKSNSEDASADCRLVEHSSDDQGATVLELGQSEESVEIGPADEGLQCELHMQTHVAGANRSHHRHQCRVNLFTHQHNSFQFTLAPPAEVLHVFVDGLEVEPRVQDAAFHLPISPESREVQIDYLTPAAIGIMTSDLIPLPKSSFAPGIVEWRVLLPADRRTSAQPAESVVVHESGKLNFSQRLLGPLARHESESVFWLSNSAPGDSSVVDGDRWMSDSSKGGLSSDSDSDLLFVADGGLQTLKLDLWDVQSVRSLTWTCLLGAFLLLLSLRRYAPIGWKYPCLICVATAFAAAWFGSPPVAMTAGGVLMGSLLAAAIPRRVIHPRKPVNPAVDASTEHRTSLAASGTIGILLICCSSISMNHGGAAQRDPNGPDSIAVDGLGDECEVQDPLNSVQLPEVDVEYDLLVPVGANSESTDTVLLGSRLQHWYATWQETRGHRPTCLIGSANYQVTFAPEGLPLVNARFEAFIGGSGVREVMLPLNNVVVVGAAEARVNQQRVSLVPTSAGDGFLISLPEGFNFTPDAIDSETDETEDATLSLAQQFYQPATIELTFRVRARDSENLSQAIWTAGVPRVSQTDVMISAEGAAEYLVEGAAQRRETNEGFLLPLAPASRLSFVPLISSRVPQRSLSADSTIQLGPGIANVRAELAIDQTDSGTAMRLLPIQLPLHSVVRSVQPAGQIEYFVETRLDGPLLWLASSQDGGIGDSVAIDFALAMTPTSSGEWVLPALDYHSRLTRHRLEVTPLPGYQWKERAQSSAAIDILVSDEVAEDAIPISTPETVVARVIAADETYWSIEPIVPVREAHIDERLEVDSASVVWMADLVVESKGAPFFEYVCGIDPVMEITSVSVQRDGAERVIRWHQIQDRLSVFVEGDQPGMQNVRINGRIRSAPEGVFQWPRFDLPDVEISSRSLRLLNRGDSVLHWDMLVPNAGRLMPGEEVTLGLDNVGLSIPSNLRFDPPARLAQIEQSIWMMPSENNTWTIWQTLKFRNDEQPVLEQVVRIPETWAHVSVQADGGRLSEGADSEGRWIRVEVPSGNLVQLHLLTRLSADADPMSLALTEGAGSTTLLLPRSVAINSTEWREVALSSDELAPEGFAAVKEWAAYRAESIGVSLPELPDPGVMSGMQVLHAETDVYVSDDAIFGETRYDVSSGLYGTLLLRLPLHASVQAVFVDGVQTQWSESASTIPIPADRPCVLVRVTWFAEPALEQSLEALADFVPLVDSDEPVTHSVCCWIRGGRSLLLPADSGPLLPQQLWLARWSSLYEVAQRSGAGAVHNQDLQWRIGQCEAAIGELVDAPSGESGNVSAAGLPDEISGLSNRWDALKRSWPVFDGSALSDSADVGVLQPLSWQLTQSDFESCRVYRVTFGDSFDSKAPIAQAAGPLRDIAIGVVLTVLLLFVSIWAVRRTTDLAWNDWLARHPRVAWMLLGLAWWLWLSPSVIGFVILVLAVLQIIQRRFNLWRSRSRRLAVPSTITR